MTHGFELHCDPRQGSNNLEVNWNGNKFHLDTPTSAVCTDDPSITPRPPAASFDTYRGTGVGHYNGTTLVTAEGVFTDAGEPGNKETATLELEDSSGHTVLPASGSISKGNQQAHGR